VRSVAQLTAFDYLLARYQPSDRQGWRLASATFDLAGAARTNGRVRLLISGTEPTTGAGTLRIRNVTITMARNSSSTPTLTDALRRWVRSWLP
jgi:hypothetical protein